MLHEGVQRLVGKRLRGALLVHAADVGEQHEQILGREVGEADDRPRQVDQPVTREGVFSQARLQRLVAVQAAPRIHQKLRRPSHQHAEAGGAALQHVIQDAQDLFVVAVARLAAHQLVQIDHLIQNHQQALVTGLAHERREQLEVIVNAGVVDDRAHAEGAAGIGAGGEFRPQPAHGTGLQRFVAAFVALPITADHGRKVVAPGQLLKVGEPGADDPVGGHALLLGLPHRPGHEPLHHAGHGAAAGPGAGRGAAGELGEQ